MSIKHAEARIETLTGDPYAKIPHFNDIDQKGKGATCRYIAYLADKSSKEKMRVLNTARYFTAISNSVKDWKTAPMKVYEKVEGFDLESSDVMEIPRNQDLMNDIIYLESEIKKNATEGIREKILEQIEAIKSIASSLNQPKDIENTQTAINQLDLCLTNIQKIESDFIEEKKRSEVSYWDNQRPLDKKVVESIRIQLEEFYKSNPTAQKVNSLLFQYKGGDKIFGIKEGILLYTTLLGENWGVKTMYDINDAYIIDKKAEKAIHGCKDRFPSEEKREELRKYSAFFDRYPQFIAYIEEQKQKMITEITQKHEKIFQGTPEDSKNILASKIDLAVKEFNQALASELPGVYVKTKEKLLGYCCKAGLLYTLLEGNKIHFVLDGINMDPILTKRKNDAFSCGFGGTAGNITNQEVRFACRVCQKHPSLRKNIIFWKNDKIVPAPWEQDPTAWQAYQPKMEGIKKLEPIISEYLAKNSPKKAHPL